MADQKLTHIDEKGDVRMVDVSEKDDTKRVAVAEGFIAMHAETLEMITSGSAAKGDVLACARVAGVMAAKKTSELIPMCHPLLISGINCDIEELADIYAYKLTVSVKIDGKTGVEMEALTGVSVGLLTIYDMIKAIDKTMQITDIALESKSGGKSGDYVRSK